jgi:hypothetical protein
MANTTFYGFPAIRKRGLGTVFLFVVSPVSLFEFKLFYYFAQLTHLPQLEVAALVPVCGFHELEELLWVDSGFQDFFS